MCLPSQLLPLSLVPSPIMISGRMAPEKSLSLPLLLAPSLASTTMKRRRVVRFAPTNEEERTEEDRHNNTHSRRGPRPLSPPSPLDRFDDCASSDMWYGPADLDAFRNEARVHCRRLREEQQLLQQQQQQQQQQQLLQAAENSECYASDSSSSSSSEGSAVVRPSKKHLQLMDLGGKLVHDDNEKSENNSSAEDDDEDDRRHSRGLEQRCCLERQRRKYLTNRCIVRAQKQLTPGQLAELARRCTLWASALAVEEGRRDYIRAYKQHHHVKSTRGGKRSAANNNTTTTPEQPEARNVRPRLSSD